MPYKDPEERRRHFRERRAKLKQDPEELAVFHQREREYRQRWLNGQSPEDRDKRLQRRRKKRAQDNPNYKPRVKGVSEEERRAKRRESARLWARRNYASNPQESYRKYREYWQSTLPERKAARRTRISESGKIYRQMHPELPGRYYKENKVKWNQGIDCRDPKVWRTAEEKSKILMVSLGYSDIFQPDFVFFYFDFAARKDGRVTVFQVTTLRTRQVRRKHIELARYFDWDYIIIHVRPTLTEAYITRIDTTELPDKKSINYHYAKGQHYTLTEKLIHLD